MPALLLVCFFLSGATGLLFEVVWTRLIGHVFGSDTLAISTVLATFMGGLALGSWIGGRIADRMKRDPLYGYAICEAGIAIWGMAIPWVIDLLPPVNAWLWKMLSDWPLVLALLRFVLCAALLLPPTTLMGATLPLLARRVIRGGDDVGQLGRRVGALYAANTAGAVVGVASAGFLFIPTVGVATSNWIAVVIDLVLAFAVGAAVWRRRAAPRGDVPERGSGEGEAPEPTARSHRRLALIAFGVSGFVAMTLEVLWSRTLALVIGSSVYSFTMVLIVFLFGLSVGAAWLGRPAARSRDPWGVLAVVFAVAGASVIATHAVADELPKLFLWLLEGSSVDVGTILIYQALLAGAALFPTAACLGAVMPLCVRAYAGSVDAVGRDVGRAYAANTVGAILGSFAGGFVVLPLVGLETGVRACAIADLALALALAWRARSRRLRAVSLVAAPALAIAAILAPSWNVGVLTSGVFRMTLARRFVASGSFPVPEVVYYRDGVSTTVTVERHDQNLALKNNGKVEASSRGDMPTQILVGLVPVLLHGGEAQRVAVVGYGSGVTVGAIAEAPEVARVDVVELEPLVYEAADRFFGPYNHRPEANPKVRRFVGDGRNFLTARPETYDVIVSEPSNPWIAGVASLFTREFYAFAKRHLSPGGVFCQWAQLYELGPRNVKMIYRTFHEAFPYVYAFSAADSSADTILVGSERPIALDLERLRARFADERLAAELSRGGARSAEDLVAMLLLGPTEVPAFSAGAEVNTDDSARLEFSAPRDLLGAIRGVRFADSVYHDSWPYGHLDELVRGVEGGEAEARLGVALISHGKRREGAAWLARARAHGAAGAAEQGETLLRLARLRLVDERELPLDAGGPPFARGADARVETALAAVAEARWFEARVALADVPRPPDSPEGDDLRLLSAFALYKTFDFDGAEKILEDLAADAAFVERRPTVLYYYGRVLYGLGRFQRGADELLRFAARAPELAHAIP